MAIHLWLAMLPMTSALTSALGVSRASVSKTPRSDQQAILAQGPYAQPLPYPWEQLADQDGNVYYFQPLTGEAQWELPQEQQNHGAQQQAIAPQEQQNYGAQQQAIAPQEQQNYGAQQQAAWHHPHGTNRVLWRVAGVSGTHSRYNLRKHDVQILSRYNMLKQRLTVSRKQAMVSCNADGTATLTSVGKGPTLWRERGGPWCSVQRGEGLVLTDGDELSLDCNDPEGAHFACQQKSAVQGGYQQDLAATMEAAAAGYAQQGQPQAPTYPWETMVDQSGAVYFYNSQSGESQWEDPQQAGVR